MKIDKKLIAGLAMALLLLGGVVAVYIGQHIGEERTEIVAGLGRDPGVAYG